MSILKELFPYEDYGLSDLVEGAAKEGQLEDEVAEWLPTAALDYANALILDEQTLARIMSETDHFWELADLTAVDGKYYTLMECIDDTARAVLADYWEDCAWEHYSSLKDGE